MTTMQVTVGPLPFTGLKPIRSAEENLAQTTAGTAMTTQLSGFEDGPAETAIKLATANTAYQAALQTTASIGQTSLLDFLR